jgi:hypothetical protein
MHPPARKRPVLVTLLGLGVLTFSVFYLARAVAGLSLLARPALPLTIPLWYLPATGILWSVIGGTIVGGLMRGTPWAPHLLRWGTFAYVAWYWLDRILLARSDYARQTIPASAIATVLGVVLILAALQRRSTRNYFRET